ncbi:MAG TPA: threonine synthase [Candidatus Limnocylindrales bacterium]|nr:threonine synthase [Candidatus Limnocylindrales bacterium]
MGRIAGLRCRACSTPYPTGPNYVCARCFGPLEVVYDEAEVRETLTREAIASRPAGIWRYRELLPVSEPPERGLPVGSTPLQRADRLAARLGVERIWLKNDSLNPTLSFKDRVVAVAVARAVEFGFTTLACASTGNLAGAIAAAAGVVGLPSYVFVPADIEPGKIRQAIAFGARLVPIAGTYDEINRLSVEVADELGWAVVNVTLRPFYAEGSKTLAYEVAEQLGWRLPDVVVAPIASGSLYTKVAKGFDELARYGLVEPKPIRFVGAQPEGCAPVAAAWATGAERPIPVREPSTIVKSLAIGIPADGSEALRLARESGGSIEAVDDAATVICLQQVAAEEGILAEPAGGCTLAALEQAVRRGLIDPTEEVVVLLTGNGLKTPGAIAPPDALDSVESPIPPTYAAFEGWLEQREGTATARANERRRVPVPSAAALQAVSRIG